MFISMSLSARRSVDMHERTKQRTNELMNERIIGNLRFRPQLATNAFLTVKHGSLRATRSTSLQEQSPTKVAARFSTRFKQSAHSQRLRWCQCKLRTLTARNSSNVLGCWCRSDGRSQQNSSDVHRAYNLPTHRLSCREYVFVF